MEWYLWKYEEGTKLVLISGSPTSNNLILNYAKSYNNSLFFMNDISSQIYGCNIDGISARSINMVDILEKIFEYKQSVTYENENISLIDNDGKALTSIITENGTVIDSVSLSMLQSNNTYWIASRDYQSETNSNKSRFDYNVKQWNNNQIVPATIYKSNVTSGQTALSGAIRPMIEVNLTKVKISADGTITALS